MNCREHQKIILKTTVIHTCTITLRFSVRTLVTISEVSVDYEVYALIGMYIHTLHANAVLPNLSV